MPGESLPPSPAAAPKRPSLVHRHSSQSTITSHVSQSPGDSHGHGPRPGYHKAHSHKHLVGHGRPGRNPSFHRSLSKIKVNTTAAHGPDDEGPPTPKSAKLHRRTHSTSGAATPASPLVSVPASPGPKPGHGMKRNNTSLALPRTASHAGLKKNHSSGQLSRLGSSKNIAGHGHKGARQERPDLRRANTQPHKRHKSPAPEIKHATVHFDVGSSDDDNGQEIMEGVDDVWTEDSASASPNTTRDNTRNNTRHNSIVLDPVQNPYAQNVFPRHEDDPPDAAAALAQETTVSTSAPPSQSPAPTAASTTRDFANAAAPTPAPAAAPALASSPAGTVQEPQQQRQSVSQEQQQQQSPKQQYQPPQPASLRPQQTQFDLPFRQQEHQRQQLRQQHEELRRAQQQKLRDQQEQEDADEDDDDDDDDNDSEDTASEETTPPPPKPAPQQQPHRAQQEQQQQQQYAQHPQQQSQPHHFRPLDTDMIAKRLLEKNGPAPPRVSSISALANASTTDVRSLSQSQNGNLHPTGANNTPVVSRFVGPDDGIGSKDGTPRNQSGFLRSHSRTNSISKAREGLRRGESDTVSGNLQRNKSAPNFAAQDQDRSGVQSPTTHSGAQTPTGTGFENNSRTQQKLWLQRGLSNIEASSTPHLPGLLPTGRAQAMRTPQKGMQFEFVDREYAVVRRFHNPLLEAVERLRSLNRGTLPGRPKAALPPPPATANTSIKRPETSKSAKSVKSVKSSASMAAGSMRSHRESAGQRAKVSFHTGASPESGRQSPVEDSDDEDGGEGHEGGPDGGQQRALTAGELARRIWEGGPVGSV